MELLTKAERWDEARAAAAGRVDLLAAFSLSHARWLERTGRLDEARQAYRFALYKQTRQAQCAAMACQLLSGSDNLVREIVGPCRDAQHPEDAEAMLRARISAALKRRRYSLAASLHMDVATDALAQVGNATVPAVLQASWCLSS